MRVSVTTLEQFRYFMEEPCWCKGACKCEEKLIASIRGKYEPDERMNRGSKFHAALETGRGEGFDGESLLDALLEVDGGRLAEDMAARRGVREAKFTHAFGPVLISGKYDYQVRTAASDWKTTDGYAANDFERSLQWRLTLACLPELTHFRYESFRVWLEDGETLLRVKYLPPGQEFTRYVGLEADCLEWIDRFVAYVNDKGLQEHVASRVSTECPF